MATADPGFGTPTPVPAIAGGASPDAGAVAPDRRRERRILALLVVPMVVLTIVGWVADALSPTLLARAPWALVAMSPRSRVLVLAEPFVPAAIFFAVAVSRQMLGDPLFYVVGRRYGDRGIRWIEHKTGASRAVQLLERAYSRAAYPMVAIVPNNVICLLAGATGMRPAVFIALNLFGTMVKVALIMAVGDVLSTPIRAVVGWIGEYQVPLTALMVALVVTSVVRSRRRGTLEIESVDELERELEPPVGAPACITADATTGGPGGAGR